MRTGRRGFTLIELLIVVAIVGVLASIVVVTLSDARESAYLSSAKLEARQVETALERFVIDHGTYPEDVPRGVVPEGLGEYLNERIWERAPWPRSVYDWDHWSVGGEDIYQLSIRFCDQGDSSGESCAFPRNEWVTDEWDERSGVFWCFEGLCRAHADEPPEHPGYCLNCSEPLYPYGLY